ncbi:hypothetical protein Nepgr_021884 [Nepenthes gracilis]|uniref:PPM-type phosphatase domain-containing protein n=1 Tax=Nepenthes gracilis TaxID=150966 RepID=A0AAD3SXK8_NEPGR|nr:hypothetical protein Nepgr_021884 [Nepenthes gracilis]
MILRLALGHQRRSENEVERSQLLSNHPDDTATITSGRVKGKLKVTQAFGVGYLKKKNLNDVLMGILKVCNLMSPAYISISPSMNIHTISESDHFVILGSDGLFDFFTNKEAVYLVRSYVLSSPWDDPAKFLLEQLVMGAADCAGFTVEEPVNIPPGRRRKYRDNVTGRLHCEISKCRVQTLQLEEERMLTCEAARALDLALSFSLHAKHSSLHYSRFRTVNFFFGVEIRARDHDYE